MNSTLLPCSHLLPALRRAIIVAGICGLGALTPMRSIAAPSEHDGKGKWIPLFAPDLSNAAPEGPWDFTDGVLTAKDHGAIWTKQSYHNFVLDLEFKVSKDANSGVFLRSGNTTKALDALEIQVHDNTDGTKYGMVGALYDCKAPTKIATKPTGEWNHYTITCRDNKITVVLNKEKILNVDLNEWTTPHLNPDGTNNKYPTALKDFDRAGPIGFQGVHGKAAAPVWFRHLRIKVLE